MSILIFNQVNWWCRSGRGDVLACQTLWQLQSAEVFGRWLLVKLELLRNQIVRLLSRWTVLKFYWQLWIIKKCLYFSFFVFFVPCVFEAKIISTRLFYFCLLVSPCFGFLLMVIVKEFYTTFEGLFAYLTFVNRKSLLFVLQHWSDMFNLFLKELVVIST